MQSPIRLFISYCHRDEQLRLEMETHLSPLAREGLIETWHDRMIVPGTPWEKSINEELQASDIYLFLVSPDFIASEYCYGKELAFALKQHRHGQATVLPIVIRPADWKGSALGQIQGLPRDGIPVTTWPNRDEAWLDVVNGIRRACKQLQEKRALPTKSGTDFKTQYINEVLTNVVERIGEIAESGAPITGISSGLPELDQHTDGFQLKEVVLVASAPQIDRFGLLIKFAEHISTEAGLPCIFVCAKYDNPTIGNRLLSSIANLPVRKLATGQLSDDQWLHLSYALTKLNEAPLAFIFYEGQAIDAVIDQLSLVSERWGVAPVVVVDSLEHLSGNKSEIVQKLKNYARRSNKLILLGSGLEHSPSRRADKRPMPSDIGDWILANEHLDCIISVYLDQIYNPDTKDQGVAELIFHNQLLGRSATIRVGYLAESQSYISLTAKKTNKAP